jgi:hypothetical protein
MDLVGAGGDRQRGVAAPWCAMKSNEETGRDSGKSRARLLVTLSHMACDQLRRRATLKGVSGATLAAMLLETIVRDDLYMAVLDN